MDIDFHADASIAFAAANPGTQAEARPILELLSTGFRITWFRCTAPHLWLAIAKPSTEIGEHAGVRQECSIIGNGYPNDFHQRTLQQEPPPDLLERIDTTIRFVASNASIAEAFCAAWAQKNKVTVLLLRSPNNVQPLRDQLYKALSSSLWRRDFFAEAEPVRDPSEFFGREAVVNELFSKIILGSPIAVFGLRKIGKSSLLGRLEDLIEEDHSAISATALIVGNSTRLKSGHWWNLANDVLQIWQAKLQKLARQSESKVYAKAERLNDAIGKKIQDQYSLATAFERDVTALLKAARALQSETNRDSVRLVLFLDECDHLYPHLNEAGHWRSDFFSFWNTLQSIKRRLEHKEELVYVLSGVNPSGVEQGALLGQPNPLYETQRTYLRPMTELEANSMVQGLSSRMGLIFEPEALKTMYSLVGGHPLLLRRLGTAIHEGALNRAARKTVTSHDVTKAFNKKKRDLFNQVIWFLEHLAQVAPDEEKLLRDIATGGALAYSERWKEDQFRETYAYHLEQYGLVNFENDIPSVSLGLIKDSLQRPVASEFVEQKRQLKDLVEEVELAVRIRLKIDLESARTPNEAVNLVVSAIPSDAKNRAMTRSDLIDLGEIAGVAGVLESLNWGDYQILLEKLHADIQWAGKEIPFDERMRIIKNSFTDAHLVRHNNDHQLKAKIDEEGYSNFYGNLAKVREMLA